MDLQYQLLHGSYYLVDNDARPDPISGHRPIRLMTDEVAIAFDRESGAMHKHGNPETVEAWAKDARAAFRSDGFDDMADDIVVFCGAIPVAEINKCLTHSGYASVLFGKLPELARQDKGALPGKPDVSEPPAPGPAGA